MKAWFAVLILGVGCKKSGGELNWEKDPVRAADAIFERYLESTGGLQASRAIQNLRIEAESEIVAQGLRLSMVIYEERPDHSRIETTIPLMGTIVAGYHDGVAWETSALTGPRVKEGREAAEARWSGRLDLYEDFRASWPERRVTGVEEFGGQPCHVLSVVNAIGRAETMYYAVDSGRWMGTRTKVTTDMGELPMLNEVVEYGEVEGVAVPTVTRQSVGPAQVITRFVKMDSNLADFPDLTPPPEILSLVVR